MAIVSRMGLLLLVAVHADECNVSGSADDIHGLLQLVRARDPACSASPKCNKLGLAGTCCPTVEGVYLYCCEQSADSSTLTPRHTTETTTKLPRKKPTPNVVVPDHEVVPAAVQLSCSGEGFLDCWTFYTEADPTHGYIEYATKRNAKHFYHC